MHQIRTRMNTVFQENVSTHFPDHKVTTDPQKLPHQSGYCWFIEPICGEQNFLRSLPDYCAVIGIFFNGSVQHAVIYHYIEDVEFYATENEGAMVNQNRLRVSGTGSLNHAMIGYIQQSSDPSRSKYHSKLIELAPSVRCSGCSALDLARVAQGKLDAYVQVGENQFIPIATSLLVTEAGGFTTPVSGTGDVYVAGNPQIFKALESSLLGTERKREPILSRKALR